MPIIAVEKLVVVTFLTLPCFFLLEEKLLMIASVDATIESSGAILLRVWII